MSLMTHCQIFHLNSRNRISGTDASFTASVPINQHLPHSHVVILEASIPKSYYLVQLGFNTFTLVEAGVPTTITIPPGNYSRRSLQSILTDLLNLSSPNHWTYTVNYPNALTEAETGKYIYQVTGHSSQPSIVCTTNVFEVLGFEPNSTNTFVGGKLQSTNVIKLQAEDTLFIHSDMASTGGTNIMAAVYSSAPDLSIIRYTCPHIESYSKRLTTTSSNQFTFNLLNEDARLMHLNGLNWQLVVMVYQKDNTNALVKENIKLSILEKEELQNAEPNDEKINSDEVL